MDIDEVLAAADPVALRGLAEQGLYDPVAERLGRVPSARDVLAWGVVFPRPDHLPRDAARAAEVLLSGLSSGVHQGRHGPTRWTHIVLPVPVLHPAAVRTWAPRIGVSAEALEALLAGELFVDRDRVLRIWPWYPEQDPTLAPLAAGRAASLGVALPNRHLDDPHEAAWVLARTGASALLGLARAAGVPDPEAARITVLPVPPLVARVRETVEGGWETDRYTLWLDRVLALCRGWEHAGEDRGAIEGMLRRAVASVLSPVPGVRPQLAEPVAPLVDDLAPGTELRDLVAIADGVVLVYDGRAVWLDGGRVRRIVALPANPVWAGVGTTLIGVQVLPTPAFDLTSGEWLTGSLGAVLDRIGAPDAVARDELLAFEHGDLDTTARFLSCSTGIVRVSDGEWLAPADQIPHEDEDREEEDLPEIGAPAPDPSARTVEIDRVRFTSRRGRRHVVPPGSPRTFGLGPDGWRFVHQNRLYVGLPARPVARLGFEARRVVLSADAGTLWCVDHECLHRIGWDDGRTETWSLEPLADPCEGLVLPRVGGEP